MNVLCLASLAAVHDPPESCQRFAAINAQREARPSRSRIPGIRIKISISIGYRFSHVSRARSFARRCHIAYVSFYVMLYEKHSGARGVSARRYQLVSHSRNLSDKARFFWIVGAFRHVNSRRRKRSYSLACAGNKLFGPISASSLSRLKE